METELLALPNLGANEPLLFLDPSFFNSGAFCFSPRDFSPRNSMHCGAAAQTAQPSQVQQQTSIAPELADWDSTGSIGSRRSSDEFSESSVQQASQAGWKKACDFVTNNPSAQVARSIFAAAACQHAQTNASTCRKDDVRLFACKEPGCDKVYTTTEGLRLHNRNIHMNDKKHKCTVEGCDRAFVRASDLKLHILRIHETERPFPCTEPDCNKSFACNSELTRHLNCHKRNKTGRKKQRVMDDTDDSDEEY